MCEALQQALLRVPPLPRRRARGNILLEFAFDADESVADEGDGGGEDAAQPAAPPAELFQDAVRGDFPACSLHRAILALSLGRARQTMLHSPQSAGWPVAKNGDTEIEIFRTRR